MIENLLVRIMGDSASFTGAAQKAKSELDAFSAKTAQIGKAMSSLGTKMAIGVTLPLAAMGKKAVGSFASFDQAMTESTSIMQVNNKQIKEMRDLALSLSTVSKQGPTELAEAYYFLASAGLDAERSMAALPVVTKFATAGAFDMALATDLLTDAQTAMGMAGNNAAESLANLARIGDVFVAANQSANTSVQQVSEAMTTDAGTAAQQMGQSLESVVAVLEAYASAGKKGSEAGNLYGRATRLLTASARENAKAFEEMNIQVVGKDGQYRNFIDIIADMEKAFEGLSKPQIAARLDLLGFKALAQKSITPLIGLSSEMKNYQQKLMVKNATESVANKQMTSFSNQMRVLRNQAEVASIAVGDRLAPHILKLANYVQSLKERFQKLSPQVQDWISIALVAAAATGPLLFVAGQLVTSFAAVSSLVVKIAGGFAALATPIGAVIAIIAIASAILVYFKGDWEAMAAAADMAVQFMVDVAVAGIRTLIRSIAAFAGWMASKMEKLWSVDFVNSVLRGIKAAVTPLQSFASWAAKSIAKAFTGQKAGAFNVNFVKDFTDAKTSGNLLGTLAQIGKEEMGNFREQRGMSESMTSPEDRMRVDEKRDFWLEKIAELQEKANNQDVIKVKPLNLNGVAQ